MSCCASRESESQQERSAVVPAVLESPASAHGGDECLQFFDCIECDEEEEREKEQRGLEERARQRNVWRKLGESPRNGDRPRNRLLEMWLNRRQNRAEVDLRKQFQESLRQFPQDVHASLECTACLGRMDDNEVFSRAHIQSATKLVHHTWEERKRRGVDKTLAEKLDDGFPELEEWTQEDVVRRFLRAAGGNEKDAVAMLVKAIECRVRDRDLFLTMKCDINCDMRVVGRDADLRPTVYICARSQKLPLKELRDQIFVAMEEAVRHTSSQDDQVVLIADMTGFSATLNMDPFVLKGLSESFGSVFADRLHSVLIVDFSLLAQTVWSTCKPLLSERTRKKINFVGVRAARKIAQERFEPATCERILNAFSTNRQNNTTAEERFLQAQRTAITEIPLGRGAADLAG